MDLINRVKNLILAPGQEWETIAREETTVGELYLRYVLVLTVASTLAGVVGRMLFGWGMPHLHGTYSGGAALSGAVFEIVVTFLSLMVMAYLVDYLAQRFDGERDLLASHKLVVYSATPGWVGGLLGIIPPLGVLGALFGLYGIYLFYAGAPTLKKIPREKAGLFTLVVLAATFLLFFFIGLITAPFHMMSMGMP